ncbi:hypothetical protein FYJ79_03110 [Sharpea azabuensis]|uniref:X-X-X-Leu-X-X-Gly heptad repeats n=1 Tax=Sharpea porci TaxID=2652286 RepID=A0A844FT28_9FIRM|nr:hypothetical protein [Sharpea porci]MST88580.1 hypothetical protein [Sharpea porci]
MKKNVLKKAIPLTVAATMMNVVPVAAYDKDETVYTKVDGDGNVTYQVVSEQLKSSKKEEIKDHSDLSNIKNISGDEKYKKDGNDLTWKSKGDDIFYQGKTTKQLPITVETSYKLDGQEISPKDASGKKGHVEISFKYTNNDKHDYNGKTLYTPFTIALATTLNSDNNKNVTINNGKVVNNGENNIIVGIAAPGLYESLNLDQLKSFDEIKIEFDTTDLDIKSFYSVATPKLATADDINGMFDKIDGSFDDLNKLKDATNQLVTGTSDLSKGAKTLSDGTKTFNSGLVTANSGAGLLTKNSKSLRDGASQLASGLGQAKSSLLDSGKLDQLVKGSSDLDAGVDQLRNGVVDFKNQSNDSLKKEVRKMVKSNAYKQAAFTMQAIAGEMLYKSVSTQKQDLVNKVTELNDLTKKAAIEGSAAISINTSIYLQNQILNGAKVENKQELDKLVQNTETRLKVLANTNTDEDNSTPIPSKNAKSATLDQLVEAYTQLVKVQTQYDDLQNTIDKTKNQLPKGYDYNNAEQDKEAALQIASGLSSNNSTEGSNTAQEDLDFLLNKHKDDLVSLVEKAYENPNSTDPSVSTTVRIMKQYHVYDKINAGLKEANQNAAVAIQTLNGGFDQLLNGIDEKNGLKDGAHQIAEGAKAFTQSSNGQISLKDALKQLASGSSKLNAGTKEYTEGVDKLAGGVSQLTSAFTQIVNGSAQLSTGADKLASGMSEYKTTGIDKLTELADTLNGDSDTAKQLTKYADEYTYTATNKDANYTTKFVYIVQE